MSGLEFTPRCDELIGRIRELFGPHFWTIEGAQDGEGPWRVTVSVSRSVPGTKVKLFGSGEGIEGALERIVRTLEASTALESAIFTPDGAGSPDQAGHNNLEAPGKPRGGRKGGR